MRWPWTVSPQIQVRQIIRRRFEWWYPYVVETDETTAKWVTRSRAATVPLWSAMASTIDQPSLTLVWATDIHLNFLEEARRHAFVDQLGDQRAR